MVSLEDERAGKLANVLGNATSKKILSLLTEKEASVSEAAKQLSLPLNTVDYNIKNLLGAGLIEEKKHMWSVKGKKIPVYALSNKYIIISPRKSFASRIKMSIPVVLIAGIFTGFIVWMMRAGTFMQESLASAPEKIMAEPAIQAREKMAEGAARAAEIIPMNTVKLFLIGAWALIVVYILLNLTRRSK